MNRQVVAQIDPARLGGVIVAAAAPLFVLLSLLRANGWTNPEALAFHGRRWTPLDLPFVGHGLTIALACLVCLLLVQFIALAMQRFEDVVVEAGRLTYATRPWLGEAPLASIVAARLARPAHRNLITRGSNNIEIVHAIPRRGGRSIRTVVLIPWFYSGGLSEIMANLQACGIEVRMPPSAKPPVWDRELNE